MSGQRIKIKAQTHGQFISRLRENEDNFEIMPHNSNSNILKFRQGDERAKVNTHTQRSLPTLGKENEIKKLNNSTLNEIISPKSGGKRERE